MMLASSPGVTIVPATPQPVPTAGEQTFETRSQLFEYNIGPTSHFSRTQLTRKKYFILLRSNATVKQGSQC